MHILLGSIFLFALIGGGIYWFVKRRNILRKESELSNIALKEKEQDIDAEIELRLSRINSSKPPKPEGTSKEEN